MSGTRLSCYDQLRHNKLRTLTCIDLTHVPAFVHLLHLTNSQLPDFLFRIEDGNAMIFGNDLTAYRENRLRIDTQPSDLEKESRKLSPQ